MRKAIGSLNFLALAVLATGCVEKRGGMEAARCYVIEADEQSQPGLSAVFDRFAASRGLTRAEEERPLDTFGYAYKEPDGQIVVSLSLYMGNQRASVSLFDRGKNGCLYCESFDQFVHQDLPKEFGLLPCSEVEGFASPELF